MKTIVTIAACALLAAGLRADVPSDDFLAVLSSVESGGDDLAVGDGSAAFGRYQIHRCVVTDVNARRGRETYRFPVDCRDEGTASEIAREWLDAQTVRWRIDNRVPADVPVPWEVYARIWNGGPTGYRRRSTARYWERFKERARTLMGAGLILSKGGLPSCEDTK